MNSEYDALQDRLYTRNIFVMDVLLKRIILSCYSESNNTKKCKQTASSKFDCLSTHAEAARGRLKEGGVSVPDSARDVPLSIRLIFNTLRVERVGGSVMERYEFG